ncbi:hypothetical protein VCRA2119O44_30417 [Vibrio crassostreae]|nr:hypothetical protein VCRA2113O22_370037 [Vibrio crassostreae]CAK2112654.1 hypothetical protein VCRA2119O44_30417 [Vibrio crassostreae]
MLIKRIVGRGGKARLIKKTEKILRTLNHDYSSQVVVEPLIFLIT